MSCNAGGSAQTPSGNSGGTGGSALAAYSPTAAQPRTGALAGMLHWFTEDARTPGCQVQDLDDWDTYDAHDEPDVEVYPERDMVSEIRSSWFHSDIPGEQPTTPAATSTSGWETIRVSELADRDARNARELEDTTPANPGWFPWWRVDQLGDSNGDTYLVRTRMKNRSGEALLVDPGSPGNLTGDEWGNRMAESQRKAGLPPPSQALLDQALDVGGVGSGSQRATHAHRYQLALQGGEHATYEAPVLPNSSVPALLGRKTLRDQRVLLDCFNNRMYRIGPGGYSLQLSPGSAQYHLEESHAGHLMLPCDAFDELATSRSSGSARMLALATSPIPSSTDPTMASAPTSAKRRAGMGTGTTSSTTSGSGAPKGGASGQPDAGGLQL